MKCPARVLRCIAWFVLLFPIHGELQGDSLTLDVDALGQTIRPAVLLIVVTNDSGLETAQGTGFLVSRDGKVITNRHVARAGAGLFAKTRNGKRYRVLGVLAEDHEHDLVLLQIEGTDFPSLPLGSTGTLRTGEPVAVVGNPLGVENVLSVGTIIDVKDFLGERGWIEISAPIQHGSSGSPVLNRRGEVIGVVTLMLRRERTLGLAIPIEAAKRLLAVSRGSDAPRPLTSMARRSEDDVFADRDFLAAASACLHHEYEEAQKRIEEAQARFPESATVHVLRGEISEGRGDYAIAVAACQEAVKLNPNYLLAWCALGSAYQEQRNYGEARQAYLRATELKPDYVDAWENLGWVCMEQGRYGEAADAYRQVSQWKPDDQKTWYNLGLAYGKLKKYDQAAWAFKVAVKLKPEESEFWRELGTAYAKQGEYRMAADALEHALKIKPTDSVAIFNLGIAYVQLDQPAKARRMLELLRPLDKKKAQELETMMQ